MDVVSAVASVIAIGQALGALPKIVDTLRSLAEVKGELAGLLNELSTLQGLHSQIQQVMDEFRSAHRSMPAAVPEGAMSLLKNANAEIELLVRDLEKLAQGFRDREFKGSRRVTNTIKWTLKKGKVAALYARARKCREDLHMAMSTLLMFGQSTGNRLLLEVHAITTISMPQLHGGIQAIEGTVYQELREPGADDADSEANAAEEPTASGAELPGSSSHIWAESATDIPTEAPLSWNGTSSGDMVFVKTKIQLRCGYGCNCQCHTPPVDLQSPSWLKPLLGRFFLNYQSQPLFRPVVCDKASCRNSRPAAVHLHYYFPSWLWNGAVSFSASLSRLTGSGATFHMSVPRFIGLDNVFSYMWRKDIARMLTRIDSAGILPADRYEIHTVLGFALQHQVWPVVKSLIQVWPPRLIRQAYDSTAFSEAERDLALGKLDAESELVVKTLLSIWDDDFDPDAANRRSSKDLIALAEGGSTIVERNRALQEACILGDPEATRALIKADADVDATDFQNATPLILALRWDNNDCALMLLNADCDVWIKTKTGGQALHCALNGHLTPKRFQVLQQLIPKMGRQSKPDRRGHYAIHELAFLRGDRDELFQNIVSLLLDSGEDIEARDWIGNTPVLFSVARNNPGAFKALNAAGACLTAVADGGQGIFQYAARFAGPALLRCLIAAQISTDIEWKDVRGNTALDDFRYCMYKDPRDLPYPCRRPDEEQSELFEQLLRTVRDRYLNLEIQALLSVITLLQRGGSLHIADAKRELDAVMEEKRRYRKHDELETLRVIRDVQISQGMLVPAIEALQEVVELHKEAMLESPFAKAFKYDWMRPGYWEETSSDEEDSWEEELDEEDELDEEENEL
ncbi:hypothetical protein B0T19DRAFT_430009 [Cercophora scortea]|uniref:Fungal N-terminal domain-containing protein n=1 Tax=Cercophora scortea TaxID=314031 RepID=A0AAE0M6A6_9PEZI|nr:hypothetical protein B0T19DRAFT_430009 [Cercophora scortea]